MRVRFAVEGADRQEIEHKVASVLFDFQGQAKTLTGAPVISVRPKVETFGKGVVLWHADVLWEDGRR